MSNVDKLIESVRAAIAIRGIGPETQVAELIAALKDESDQVRVYAAIALGCIGSDAKEALPALVAASKDDSNRWVREQAAMAAAYIDPEAR